MCRVLAVSLRTEETQKNCSMLHIFEFFEADRGHHFRLKFHASADNVETPGPSSRKVQERCCVAGDCLLGEI